MASSSTEGEIRLWPRSPDVAAEHRLQLADAMVCQLAFDPESRFVVGCGTPLVIPTDGSAAWRLSRPEDDCRRDAVAVGPSGRWVAAGGRGNEQDCWNVRLWDLETGETHLLDIGGRAAAISRLQFTPDGLLLVLADDLVLDGESLFLLNLEKGTHELLSDLEGVWWFELSGDGRTIAYVSRQERENGEFRRCFVYDMETGVNRNLPAHEGILGQEGIRAIAIDPTGKLVATGDETGAVRVGPVTVEEPHLLLGHQGPVTWTAFSPDGKWLATAGRDQTVRLWPVPEGRPLHTLPYEDLLEKLRSLTNMRVVPDERCLTRHLQPATS